MKKMQNLTNSQPLLQYTKSNQFFFHSRSSKDLDLVENFHDIPRPSGVKQIREKIYP